MGCRHSQALRRGVGAGTEKTKVEEEFPEPHPRRVWKKGAFNVRKAKTAEPFRPRSASMEGHEQEENGQDHSKKPRPRRKLTTSKSAAVRLRKEWIAKESQVTLGRRRGSDTTVVMQHLGDMESGMIGKEQVRSMFAKVVGTMDNMLFDKIFALFDVDDDGFVAKDDFIIALTFLSQQGSTSDNVELAFRLFDVDANGSISQTEFNTMVFSIVSNRLKYALQTDYGRRAFKDHMKREWSAESVEFWETVVRLCEMYEGSDTSEELYGGVESTNKPTKPLESSSGIPMSVAQTLFEQYIAAEAPDQINIASNTHESIADSIKRAKDAGEETVPVDSFKKAAQEIMQLMEQDNFERFRENLAKEAALHAEYDIPENEYAEEAWKRFNLSPSEGLTLEMFRTWAEENPGYFKFLDEMQLSLQRLLNPENADEPEEKQEVPPSKALPSPKQSPCSLLHVLDDERRASSPESLLPGAAAALSVEGHLRPRAETTNAMPRRMYRRAMTSLVSLSVQEDTKGNKVKVITFGLGTNGTKKKPSLVATLSHSSCGSGQNGSTSSLLRRSVSDFNSESGGVQIVGSSESNGVATDEIHVMDASTTEKTDERPSVDDPTPSSPRENSSESAASKPQVRVLRTNRGMLNIRKVSKPSSQAYLEQNEGENITVVRFNRSPLTFC